MYLCLRKSYLVAQMYGLRNVQMIWLMRILHQPYLLYFPCTMNNPIYNARLQKWFKRNADLQCSNVLSLPDCIGEIAIPTTAFNVIYQLTHLYHHFFDEGIGMRQIIDYFLVVNDFSKNVFLDTDFSNHPVPLPKEGSTFSPSPSSSGSGDVTAPSRRSKPLRYKDGGASKPSPDCAGWDRQDIAGYSLQLIVYRFLW